MGGIISSLSQGRLGKTLRYVALTAALTTGSGIGQQVMNYMDSRDTTADIVEVVQTDADRPMIENMNFQQLAQASGATRAAEAEPGATGQLEEEAQPQVSYELKTGIRDESRAIRGQSIDDVMVMPGEMESAPLVGYEFGQNGSRFPTSIRQTSNNPVTLTAINAVQQESMEDVSIKMSGQTVQSLINSMNGEHPARQAINENIDNVDTQMESQLENLGEISGSVLASVRAPLPTDEKPMFYMGVPNLGSKDFYKNPTDGSNWTITNPTGTDLGSVREEKIPISIGYNLNQQAPDFKVESRMFTPEQEPAPPSQDKAYVFLMGVKSTVSSEKASMSFSGNVDLTQDLDGKATQAKMDRLAEIMQNGSPEQVNRASSQVLTLKNRMLESQQLKGRTDKAGVTEMVGNVIGSQDKEFDVSVNFDTGRPLTEATHYFWLGPDKDGDNKADLYVTQEVNASGLQSISVGDMNIRAAEGTQPGNSILKFGKEKVDQQIHKQIDSHIRQQEGMLKQMVQYGIQESAKGALPGIDEMVNKKFAEQLTKVGQMEHGFQQDDFSKDFQSRINGLEVVNQDGQSYVVAKVDIGDKSVDGLKESFARHVDSSRETVEAGKILVTADGHNINQMLKDRSEGGGVNWGSMLEKVAGSNDIVEGIEFNKDTQGRTVYPRIIMEDGKPYVNVDVTVNVGGIKPVKAVSDISGGASGMVSDGVGAVSDGTIGQLGEPGRVASGVVKTPFKLIDGLVKGTGEILSGTVGKVVDAVPNGTTGSRVPLNLNIPVEVSAEDGKIDLQAHARGMQVEGSRFKVETKAYDLIPTRIIAGALGSLTAEIAQDDLLSHDKPLMEKSVDLQNKGINLEDARMIDGGKDQYGDTVPIIKIQASPNANFHQAIFGNLNLGN
ncbi:MAG: hypothetical protein ACLFQV_01605 [Vulcanimicrobiota bacterium]